jgi:ABC-2 type transport system permease protein
MAVFAILYNVIIASVQAPREASFGSVVVFLAFPLFLVVMFVDIVTAEENKEHTMKNTVSFGISRSKIFIAKNISAILIAAVVAAVTLAAFFGSGFILLAPGKGYTPAFLSDILLRISIALLLYVAAITLGTLLAIIIKRNALFTFAYFGALVVPPLLFKLLTLVSPVFANVKNAMLYSQAQILAQATPAQMLTTVWISLAHIAVFTILGLVLFNRQEIN